MGQERLYSVGDWIVHTHYGIGQIKTIEVKPLQGEQAECFKVKTKESIYWFATQETENPRIRPVGSQDIIKKVISNLRRKPGNFEEDKKYWEEQIKAARANSDLLMISQLVRDLSAQQSKKRLNHSQVKALSEFKGRLLREWTTIMGADIEEIRLEIDKYIKESKAKIVTE